MKIDRVTYQKIFPTGMMYLNHKIGIEIQVDDNDNPDTVYEYAKQKVEQWNIESNPGMAAAMEYMKASHSPYPDAPLPVVQVNKETDNAIAALTKDIEACTELDGVNGLNSWRKIVETNPSFLQDAFDRTKKKIVERESKEIIDKTNARTNNIEKKELLKNNKPSKTSSNGKQEKK